MSARHVSAEHLAALTHSGEPRLGTTRLLSIDGRSGAGKTELAIAVAAQLAAPVLHLDLAYRGWHGLAAGLELVKREVLESLQRGERAGYRPWDWHVSRPTAWTEMPATPVLVMEGVGACTRALRPFATTTVWVATSAAARKKRALARDGDIFSPHWDAWAAQEDAIFAHDDVAARVDVVIDNEESR